MSNPWIGLFLPIAALALNVMVQITSFRIARGRHFLRSVALGFFAGAIALVIFQVLECRSTGTRDNQLVESLLLVNLPIYTALAYCFFNFANLGQSSVRVRIYEEIASSPSGVPVSQITREYDDETILCMRLNRLLESGDLVEREGRLHIGRSRLITVAGVIFALKRFVLGKTSEFE